MTRTARRATVVVDLGFGDAGKGTVVDYLVRSRGAGLVVRFHGGAQAGHNVVLADGRHHTFAQLGAGSFVPGVRTFLAAPFVLHPTALCVEARILAQKGVTDPLAQLSARGHDVVVFHVLHPDELTLPFDEPTRFEGLEGEPSIDADPTALRARYQQEIQRFLDECRARCTATGARYVLARTDVPAEHTLAETLRARGRRGWA